MRYVIVILASMLVGCAPQNVIVLDDIVVTCTNIETGEPCKE